MNKNIDPNAPFKYDLRRLANAMGGMAIVIIITTIACYLQSFVPP